MSQKFFTNSSQENQFKKEIGISNKDKHLTLNNNNNVEHNPITKSKSKSNEVVKEMTGGKDSEIEENLYSNENGNKKLNVIMLGTSLLDITETVKKNSKGKDKSSICISTTKNAVSFYFSIHKIILVPLTLIY